MTNVTIDSILVDVFLSECSVILSDMFIEHLIEGTVKVKDHKEVSFTVKLSGTDFLIKSKIESKFIKVIGDLTTPKSNYKELVEMKNKFLEFAIKHFDIQFSHYMDSYDPDDDSFKIGFYEVLIRKNSNDFKRINELFEIWSNTETEITLQEAIEYQKRHKK